MNKEQFSFGVAARKMQCGQRVARKGWNGKGMFIFLIDKNSWHFVNSLQVTGVKEIDKLPFICMKTACNSLVPWLASQTDVLAEDWSIVDEEEGEKEW